MRSSTSTFRVIFGSWIILLAILTGSLGSEVLAEPQKATALDRLGGSISGEESSLEKFLPPPKKQTAGSDTLSTDEADRQLKFAWEEWFFHVRAAIHRKLEVECQKAYLSRSLVLRTAGVFSVSRDGYVSDPKILESSGDETFDSVVLDVIKSMSRSELLRFPEASNKESITVAFAEVYRTERPSHGPGPETPSSGAGTVRPYFDVWDEWKWRISKPIESTFLTLSQRARLTSPKLKVVVRFKVTNRCQLTDIAVLEPSSNKAFNVVVIESIRRTSGNSVLKFPDERMTFREVVFTFDNRRYGPSPGYRAVPREKYSAYPEYDDSLKGRK